MAALLSLSSAFDILLITLSRWSMPWREPMDLGSL